MKHAKPALALLMLAACIMALCACAAESPSYAERLTLIGTYPHDTDSFTQGLFFHDGQLYESTGLRGQSRLFKNVDISTGAPEAEASLSDELFGEGAVFFEGSIYMLTYRENTVLLFDPGSLALKASLPYPREGWGLTTDGECLIASDGTATLFFMDGQLNTLNTIEVTHNGQSVENLNELEYIDGEIWANVWLEDHIVIIDPGSGEVKEALSFAELVPERSELKNSDSVLNGIALDPQTGKIYITGKNWPALFEFEMK